MSPRRRLALLFTMWVTACTGATEPTANAGTALAGDAEEDGADEEDIHPTGDGAASVEGDGEGDGEACNTVLVATVRDFRADHADFENDAFNSDVALPGIVLPDLGTDRKPVYASAGPTRQTTGPAEFAEWYHDTPGINQAFEVEIPLAPDGSGTLVFDSQAFFPIDGEGFGNEATDRNEVAHNFHFTTEIHTEFEYRGGETFTFNGDDDVWVFIHGKLAIDLGGLHPKLLQSVDLDEAASRLGITRGQRYAMDIFHAERHAKDSTFRIETTIDCLVPVVVL